MKKNLLIFCGSHNGNEKKFRSEIIKFGTCIAEFGINLVYGGSSNGLMGILALTVLQNGGHVTGIIPQFLEEKEITLKEVSDIVITDTMHERKEVMFEKADVIVVAPGGYGTLEEMLEVIAYRRIGLHKKPIYILNIKGYFNPLRQQFDKLTEVGFGKKTFLKEIFWYENQHEMLSHILNDV